MSLLSYSWWCSHCPCRNHGRSRGSTVSCKCRAFPAEGAAGLASNSQAWLREPRLQSPRHCSPGQRLRRNTDLRCPPREGPTEGVRRHAWLPRGDPDRGHAPASWPRREDPHILRAQACLAAARVPVGGRGRAKAGVARDTLPLSRSRSQSSSCRYLVAVAVAVVVAVMAVVA
jgi:hypothetical protein